MARIDIELGSFQAARADLAQLALRQRSADAAIATARSALDAAVRRGANADETQQLSSRIAQAQSARASLAEQRRVLQRRFDELANGWVQQRDPGALVGSLDGHV